MIFKGIAEFSLYFTNFPPPLLSARKEYPIVLFPNYTIFSIFFQLVFRAITYSCLYCHFTTVSQCNCRQFFILYISILPRHQDKHLFLFLSWYNNFSAKRNCHIEQNAYHLCFHSVQQFLFFQKYFLLPHRLHFFKSTYSLYARSKICFSFANFSIWYASWNL